MGPNKNPYVLLILILILAFALRLPGMFWGVKVFHKPHFVEYHPDEQIYTGISENMLSVNTQSRQDHIQGLSFQMVLLSHLLKPSMRTNEVILTLIGRILSLIFGVLTVGIVYFLSKEIFKDTATALFSSLLLAFSGLHVTQSHQAVPDADTIFWWYAAMYFSLIYFRYNKNVYLALACFSIGLALAVKLSFLSLVPIVYILIKKRLNPFYWLLYFGGIFIVFVAAQGGHYSFHNFMLTLGNVRNDNLSVINVQNNKWWNPLIYLVGVPPALGLANFILLGTGIFFLRSQLTGKFFQKDYFFILVLPLLLQVLVLCSMDITTSRHFLPLVPFLMMIAAYALNEMRRVLTPRSFAFLLAGVILYQLVYVVGVEYYFVNDPRDKAAQWIRDNIPRGESIHLTRYTDMLDFGKRYKITKDYDTDYVVLQERYCAGYIRHKLHPAGNPYPYFEEVIHGNRMDFDQIQRMFKGESSFKLIKTFPMPCITPETFLYKKLWGSYVSFLGDTWVYQNKKTP